MKYEREFRDFKQKKKRIEGKEEGSG